MNIKTVIVLLLCFIAVAISSGSSSQRVTIAVVPLTPDYFHQTKIANPDESIQFKLMLKQKNLNKLEELFWEVSNPKSSQYRKYMNADEIDSIIAPSKSDVKIVVDWLVENKIKKNEMIIFSDYIQVRTKVEKASKLFQTEFAHYSSRISRDNRIRVSGEASIPVYVNDKLNFILGLSDFIQDNKMKETIRQARKDVEFNQLFITPSIIKQYYGIPPEQIGTNSENFQSIGAFHDFFSFEALEYFDQLYNISSSTVKLTVSGTDCLANSCDQYESDLDVQYITAFGNNVSTLFLEFGNGEWILDWAVSIQAYNPIPMVASLSYAWGEIEQCHVTDSCTTLGIDGAVYVQRTNVELQKIGLRGVSVFVSAGDDGAASYYGASGNCPIDTTNYCPLDGCPHNTTSCPSVTIALSNGTQCFYPMGTGGAACMEMLVDVDIADALNQFITLNQPVCNTIIEKDDFGYSHIYSTCQCLDLIPFTNDFLKIVGYTYEESNGALFTPNYPTSSPYVTSVGATQIPAMDSPEIVCSITTLGLITSGGGFSILQPQPSYQSAAVAQYLELTANDLPPSYAYNVKGRAYPDITLVGNNYQIVTTVDLKTNTCPCQITNVGGSSCSAPTLGGMITLINDKLLNAGKPPVGFLNPLLYQAAVEAPNVFNDITSGNNKCTRIYCCEYGFNTATGYDIPSGLGSVSFPDLEQYILSL